MSNTPKEFPDFFKVFLIEKHTERMLIPVAFAKLVRLKRRVMKDFILRDRRGRDWHVKVRPIGGKLYFDDGWKRFREDNSLEENDFLFFTHIENNVFKFKIFELSSMCEKIKVMDEEEENIMMENQEEVEVDDDDNNEDDYVDHGDVNMMAEEEEDGDEDIIMKKEKNEPVYKVFGRSEHQHWRTCKDWSIGSSSAVPKLEDDEIDAEMYIQEGNPFFFAKHMHYRRNQLHIPQSVIKDFCFCFSKYLNLVCCHCKDVRTNEIASYHHVLPQMNTRHIEKRGEIGNWSDGRVFVKGWADFCTMSNITENDRCLCEIVLREDRTVEMLMVHIVNVE